LFEEDKRFELEYDVKLEVKKVSVVYKIEEKEKNEAELLTKSEINDLTKS